MDFLHRLKAKYRHKTEKKYAKVIKRRQLNFTCDEDIIIGIRILAAALEVPLYVIAEHSLQVGAYQVLRAAKNPEKRHKLEEHLVKSHLLGDEL